MKIPVIKAFFDKNTGEPFNEGAVYESDDKKRIKELRNGGYLANEVVDETPADTSNGDATNETAPANAEAPAETPAL